MRKIIFILTLLLIQFSAHSQITDSINYDYNSEVEVRISENFETYLNDDFYLYDNESVVAADTWWQKVIQWLLYLLTKFFELVDKGGAPLAYTFYFVVFTVFIFIISKLLGLNYQTLFLKSKKITNPGFEVFDEDIHGINFDKVIKDAENSGNYRKAIRYLYISYLKVLTDNELIDWQINKTNKDYEKEMKNTEYFSLHKHLTLIYEYIWYGEFAIDKTQYRKYNSDFKKAFKRI